MSLASLDVHTLSHVLSFLDPIESCKVSCVNWAFCRASRWEPRWRELCRRDWRVTKPLASSWLLTFVSLHPVGRRHLLQRAIHVFDALTGAPIMAHTENERGLWESVTKRAKTALASCDTSEAPSQRVGTVDLVSRVSNVVVNGPIDLGECVRYTVEFLFAIEDDIVAKVLHEWRDEPHIDTVMNMTVKLPPNAKDPKVNTLRLFGGSISAKTSKQNSMHLCALLGFPPDDTESWVEVNRFLLCVGVSRDSRHFLEAQELNNVSVLVCSAVCLSVCLSVSSFSFLLLNFHSSHTH
jgi:hypothetical protein